MTQLRLVYSTASDRRTQLSSVKFRMLRIGWSTLSPSFRKKLTRLLELEPAAGTVLEKLVDHRLKKIGGRSA